ncbi:MAG: YihY/virulence factor BrkB family protein [Bryobacteraceae bacterium]|nr:YihY/virulence factor BrkB family protein [Solibacteraceae bacterium]MCL4840575.1 YihY/virulence factor BrkB family protein [Bryobacteraceae bacterium]MCO5350530.1 YihY/virulence factor BrkB family protein [Bryobacteraceae bacterium]
MTPVPVLRSSSLKGFVRDVGGACGELRHDIRPMARYWLETEAHVHAMAIAGYVLLSFYPFMLVVIALCRNVLASPEAELALYVAIRDYFPGETGDFLARNLRVSANMNRNLEWVSVVLLLFTANGVFIPLEVALNRAWGVKVNRSIVMNQLVSVGLIFLCGGLALLSAALTGAGATVWRALFGLDAAPPGMFITGLFKLASIPITIFVLFLVYWLLPNTKVPARLILPRAVVIGLALEALKWINLLIWPWLYSKLSREYGVFVNSVTILTWSSLAALAVLGGADWSARRARLAQEEEKRDRMGAELLPPTQV